MLLQSAIWLLCAILVFADLKKAFETVDHDIHTHYMIMLEVLQILIYIISEGVETICCD